MPLIVGFARAVDLCVEELEREGARLTALRGELWKRLFSGLEGVSCNGHPEFRLPGNLNVAFDGVDADQLLLALPELALSSGSACTSASSEPSHVLKALGLSDAAARSSVRFGLGRSNSAGQIAWVADRLIEAVGGLRKAPGLLR